MGRTRIESAGCSIVGRRGNNEDALCVEPAVGLFAVADGMGGYEGGEIASRAAIATLVEFFRRNAADGDATWPHRGDRARSFEESLVEVGVRAAHEDVCRRKVGRLERMGSTLALVAVRDGRAVIGHVGDSRVYRLRDGALAQLTRDHSLYAQMEAAGAVDLPPREQFPYANVITRALGTGEAVPDLRTEALRAGDVYLLCTDGLTEKLPPERMAQLLALPSAPAARALVDEAYARGGKDNITAVVLAVLG